MREETSQQGLPTTTGFAAQKRWRRFANTTSQPRRCCFELVCRNRREQVTFDGTRRG